MPAFRLDRGGEAEIVVPSDKFKSSARFDEAKKFLREKHLRGNPSFNSDFFPVIVDGESQPFIVGLRDRVEHFGAIAGVNPHTASLPSPTSFVVVKHAKPDKAV